jgi:uncharacterized protein YyaL (SSP411 family)
VLDFGCQLLEVVQAHFSDVERGGFYFTSDDHEQLINRPKSYSDEALPAGNAVAAIALQRFGWLLAEPRYLVAAESVLRGAWQDLTRQSAQHATLLQALEEHLQPPAVIVLRGSDTGLAAWQQQLQRAYTPRQLCVAISGAVAGLPPALADKAPPASGVRAWVCRGNSCEGPFDSIDTLTTALSFD